MKIKTLIKLYRDIIPYYERAVELYENRGDIKVVGVRKYFEYHDYIIDNWMEYGLCSFIQHHFFKYDYVFSELFDEKGYYYKLLDHFSYLFNIYYRNNDINAIINRLSFMKSEIKSLNKLLKKGYTDI